MKSIADTRNYHRPECLCASANPDDEVQSDCQLYPVTDWSVQLAQDIIRDHAPNVSVSFWGLDKEPPILLQRHLATRISNYSHEARYGDEAYCGKSWKSSLS